MSVLEPARARLLVALVALGCGTATATHLGAPAGIAVAVLGCLAASLRRSPLAWVGLFVCLFGVAAAGVSFRTRESALEALARAVVRCRVSGRVLEEAGRLGTLVGLERAECRGFAPAERPGILLVEGTPANAGATVDIEGFVLPFTEDPFDRARARLGADAWMPSPDVDVRAPPRGLNRIAAEVRDSLAKATTGLRPSTGALLQGLSIGQTERMDDRAIDAFRRTGLSHLVAVSGSNVAIVVGCAALLAAGLGRRAQLCVCGVSLLLYVAVVGPDPSVLRAAAMGTIALVALAAGRRTEPANALLLAVVILLILRPGLLGAAGLHLSAAATAGIVLFSGHAARGLGSLPRPLALGLGATLAAQIAVAPVLVATFGELSLIAPVTNLAAMPAVPPATILGLAAAAGGLVHDSLGRFLAALASPFCRWIELVAERGATLSWASIELPNPLGWLLAVPVVVVAVWALRDRSD